MAVVLVAYSNFHLDRDAIDTRINLVVTMILTMIALQLVMVEWMPKIEYLTWMHLFLVSCYGAIVAMCMIMIATAKMIREDIDGDSWDQTKLGASMHIFAIWGIPALVIASWVALFACTHLSEALTAEDTIMRAGRMQTYRPD